jgi:hypothetical protein
MADGYAVITTAISTGRIGQAGIRRYNFRAEDLPNAWKKYVQELSNPNVHRAELCLVMASHVREQFLERRAS